MTTFPDRRTPQSAVSTADLDDPLYYLKNFETVVNWVAGHYGDLLLDDEQTRLDDFHCLSRAAQGLLVRMVMRRGECFRGDRLDYCELGVPETKVIEELVAAGWVDQDPQLTLEQLFHLFTLHELRLFMADSLHQAGVSRSLPKTRLLAALKQRFPEAQPSATWGLPAKVVRLRDMALFERVRLMFFGNLRQGWQDFVLVELGYHSYEQVPVTADSRAFDQRRDVDCYLLMEQCRERLDAGETPASVWCDLPCPRDDNAWLENRRGRLLFELGRLAEREGNRDLALNAFTASRHREARLKAIRLLERMKDFDRAWTRASDAWQSPRDEAEERGLERLLKRLSKRLDRPVLLSSVAPASIREWQLVLPFVDSAPVEVAVMQYLSSEPAPVYYVENTLLSGLFGLLCWPALYAPLPGAFFHPFHNGPADLYREDFVERRRNLFEDCLGSLRDGHYGTRIRQAWRDKQGINCPFVFWPALNESLLDEALARLPAKHLELVFRRFLGDLRNHRSGLPDLIRFHDETPGYEMIEVKGPGDRLQDHQRRWLEFFSAHDIPASVCHVRWSDTD
ncbi:VRR-NUC domain-containing protein [Salicola sp. Rm-C-2C1-2]|uniref:VRR-NUC domain-containing protein n=1 Tax=Salicola sp. Rm-C-2C1-2 TaxID=3141321 RepID=UPI0032E38CCE